MRPARNLRPLDEVDLHLIGMLRTFSEVEQGIVLVAANFLLANKDAPIPDRAFIYAGMIRDMEVKRARILAQIEAAGCNASLIGPMQQEADKLAAMIERTRDLAKDEEAAS